MTALKNNHEYKELITKIESSIYKNNKDDVSRIFSHLIEKHGDEFISDIREQGFLRASKRNYKHKEILFAIKSALNNNQEKNLSINSIDYLKSVSTLLELAPEASSIYEKIKQQLSYRKNIAVKTLTSITEAIFSDEYFSSDYRYDSSNLLKYSKEDICESLSFLLKTFNSITAITPSCFNFIDENALSNNIYIDMLIVGCKLNQYSKAELLIDCFNYKAQSKTNNEVILSNSFLEMTTRLGYSQTELQMLSRYSYFHTANNATNTPKLPNFKKFAFDLLTENSERYLTLEKKPAPRFKISIDEILLGFLSVKSLFEEDALSLITLDIENYQEEGLNNHKIYGDICVFDILLLQRFFRFIQCAYFYALNNNADKSQTLRLRSILPVFHVNELTILFSKLFDEIKSNQIINLISNTLGGSSHFDIQYSPLIRSDDYFLVAPSILCDSNLVRNILRSFNIRPQLNNCIDPMVDSVYVSLANQGFHVEKDFYIKGTKQLETDIFAVKDGHIFLFECKNAYHPCNIHEARNSYDHIQKAAQQLTGRKEWLSNIDNQKTLFKKLNIEFSKQNEIHTCIAIANRVFNGYSISDIPVRQAHEIINVISRGIINANGDQYRVWGESIFRTQDLINYLDGNLIIDDHLKSMEEEHYEYLFKTKKLSFQSYHLNLERLYSIAKEKYQKIIKA
jgi:hypothetical protein